MKPVYNILTFVYFIFLFNACKKDNLAELNKGNTPLILNASSGNLVLTEKNKNNDALDFSWSSGSNQGTNAAITYTLMLAKSGTSFTNAVNLNIGTANFIRKFLTSELNDTLLKHFNATPNAQFVMDVKVIAQTQATGIAAEASPVIQVKITPYQPVSTTVYLVGDATPNAWDNTQATPLTSISTEPGGFTWTGKLTPGNFKFLTTLGQWLPSYNKGAIDASMVMRTDFSQPDAQWQVTTTGIYTVKVNLLDLSISVVQQALPLYSQLWIVGDATPNGWNINNPNSMRADSSNLFLFKYNEILSTGEFKIPTATGNWSTDYYMPLVNHQALNSTDVQLVKGGNPDNKWQITTAGPYKITLDIFANKIYITPFTPYTQLWLVGDATPVGWNINNPAPMSPVTGDPYTFTWQGLMTAGEFKIPTATGNWGCDYFMPQINHQSLYSTLAKFIPGGNPDNKWLISTPGNYKITINQLKETVIIEKL
jgi:hypothetical protein